MHVGGHLRERYKDIADAGFEWEECFRCKRDALRLLGKLWNSTDSLPSITCTATNEALSVEYPERWDGLSSTYEVFGGYGQAAQAWYPIVKELPDWLNEECDNVE